MKKMIVAFVCCLALFSLIACNRQSGSAAGASGPVEISVEVFDRGTGVDATRNNWTDWIQRKLLEDENIRITFVPVPRADEIPALNNMMAAGTAPDICFTYNLELVNNFRDLGGLFDMAPRAEALMPDLRTFLGPDPAVQGQYLINRFRDSSTGQMHYLPARRIFQGRYNTFIRKDWLDILGLPMPSTTEEFYQALLAFKQRDPGGIGSENVIPYISSRNIVIRAANIIESFIDRDLSDRDRWVYYVADRSFLKPGYKEGVRFMNRMYHDDLLFRDFPLHPTDTVMDDMVRVGRAASFAGNFDSPYRGSVTVLHDLRTNVGDQAEILPIDPFSDSSGRITKYSYDAAGMYIFIPQSARNPEAAMRYLNWMARDDIRVYLQTGEEGISHELINGVPSALPVPTGSLWTMFGPQNIDYVIISNGMQLDTPERTLFGLANSYTVDPELIVLADHIAMVNARPVPFLPITLTQAGPHVRTLQDKGDVLLAESITAPPGQFDRIWDAGIADWLASGATAIIEEREAKYTR